MSEIWERVILETSAPPLSPGLEQEAIEALRRARIFLEKAAHDPELARARDAIARRLRSSDPGGSTPQA